MKPDWLSDGRLIPDEVMSYLRKIAVHAVEEMGCSPEDVIKNSVSVAAPSMIGSNDSENMAMRGLTPRKRLAQDPWSRRR